jgi:L-alanine-DL-glutamate epimerase-like enolase superfamily enzyme
MPVLQLTVNREQLTLAEPFRISGFVFEKHDIVVVTVSDGTHRGRGEASGVYYLKDDAAQMIATLEAHRASIEAGMDRETLQRLLPPGGARNALDCALWELEASRTGIPVWKLAGLSKPHPLLTTFTLSAEDPATMAAVGTRKYAQARALKMKLTGELDLDIARVRAVRAARPDVWLGVDANQGYQVDALMRLLPALVECRVALVEQPIARGHEADLTGLRSQIPLAADESALSFADVPQLMGRFQVINIKLDKCGGLTEGLAMAREARRLGLSVMVGNMLGTSLAMAPGFVLGQLCDVVDLDGPILIQTDREPTVTYTDGQIACGDDVWGGGSPSPS